MENQENLQEEMTSSLFYQEPQAEIPQGPQEPQVPQYQQPQEPQVPQYQAPQYEQPQYQAPQYQQPQYQAPQYQAPQQYQQPQYQAPQYQQPQYQAPQYQAPQQYQQPQYQAPQYQPAAPAAPAGGSKVGLIMAIIGFACSMLAALLGFIGILKVDEGGLFQLNSALTLWVCSLILCFPGLACGIIGLVKKGKKGFALTAVIVSGIFLLLAFIFIATINDMIYSW